MPTRVMPALVAGIHVLLLGNKDVDGRDAPGHDDKGRSSGNKKAPVETGARLIEDQESA